MAKTLRFLTQEFIKKFTAFCLIGHLFNNNFLFWPLSIFDFSNQLTGAFFGKNFHVMGYNGVKYVKVFRASVY